ncbi:expressed protein [Cryptococcus deneoformans JEC21]|uniref:Expressed protein n=1 Tax=Cryptococcus deneoformans (strain JEC21 / ATCC MYA-565) TaxID=214684 RepID=Q5KPV5_CRYD1|nr:expressed protein [Cryptococcus neoformans var. neoformans JEC21]AAW40785.1 expressed protein [Cryptococcus neoformans var. neoformans JEC21]
MPDSDSDSSTDFFISKRKPNLKATTPPPIRSPSPAPSDSEEDPEGSGRKKKKRLNSRKPQSKLPEWARQTNEQRRERKRSSVARASTETRDRERSTSLFTTTAAEDGGGKKKERRRVELTPPPVISEKKNQELRELVQRMYGGGSALDLLDDDDLEPQAISPVASSPQKEEVVDIVVKMELDPVKKANAPAAAVRMYERPTTLKLRREETMFRALEVMGDKLQRAPDDIILIYEGKRVYSRDTARQLGILGGSSVEMKGYEKSYWDRLEAERLRRIENFDLDFDRSPSPQLIPQAHAEVSAASKSKSQPQSVGASQLYAGLAPLVVEPPSNPYTQNLARANSDSPAVAEDSIKLVVRGADGKEARMKVAKTVTAHTVLRFYCKKIDRPKDDANKMELVFDGETMGKDMTVGDMDCEDGDMLEVRIL